MPLLMKTAVFIIFVQDNAKSLPKQKQSTKTKPYHKVINQQIEKCKKFIHFDYEEVNYGRLLASIFTIRDVITSPV